MHKEVCMFWNQFTKLCNERNIKPNPLGRELGFSSGVVTKWKQGSFPNTETLMKLAKYFDVSIDYLVFGDEAENGRVPVLSCDGAMVITDQNERLLIKHYRALHYVKQIQVLSSVITEAEAEKESH